MRVKKATVEHFRMLDNATITLDEKLTIVVGRNNSAKTSFTEIFFKFLSGESPKFVFEDFSIKSHAQFIEAYKVFCEIKNEKISDDERISKEKVLTKTIPSLKAILNIEYDESDSLAVLAPLIMDLDPTRKDATISFEYAPKDSLKLFEGCQVDNDSKVIDFLRENLSDLYIASVFAIDCLNPSTKKQLERKVVSDVFSSGFIYAQRHIDDQQQESSRKLARGFEDFYNEHHENEDLGEKFQNLLNATEIEWDKAYEEIFQALIADLQTFGYPGLNSHDLAVKSQFDLSKILRGNTNIFYKHSQGNLLPESYNGLGFKNLIYIILQFINFYEKFRNKIPTPGFHLLFIEEPEVHLHPQMQHTFIKNINLFVEKKLGWRVQIIITTHSSHIISESGFSSIRYFENSTGYVRVKDLQDFNPTVDREDTLKFLQQYMSLNRCDMFFADKILLMEGTVERLLLPMMIKKLENKKTKDFSLSYQYLSLIEVGGAFAHKFKELLEFLEVKTLIITDLDSIDTKNNRKKCKVKDGDKTSNHTLVSWIPKKENIADLLKCSEKNKVTSSVRVAYQVPEKGSSLCGRSFEEAFILKNAEQMKKNKALFGNLLKEVSDIPATAYEISEEIPSKSDFAFQIVQLGEWDVPRYIEEGLIWLSGN